MRTGGSWRALCSLTECELPTYVLVHTHPVGPAPQAGREVLEGRRLRPAPYHHWHTCPVLQRCWEAEQSIKTKETCVRTPTLFRTSARKSVFEPSAEPARLAHYFALHCSYIECRWAREDPFQLRSCPGQTPCKYFLSESVVEVGNIQVAKIHRRVTMTNKTYRWCTSCLFK